MTEITYNQIQAAHVLGVTTRTLRAWDDLPEPPPRTQGKRGQANSYPARELVAWYLDYKINQLIGNVDGEVLDLNQERARLARAQTSRQELAIQRERGELLPAPLITVTWQSLVGAARARLLAIPSKLAARLASENRVPVIQAELQREVYEALNELASTGMPDGIAEFDTVSGS